MAIRVDSEKLREKADKLRVEKKVIDDVLEKFKGNTIKIDTYWSGNTGDMVKERLTKYTNKFDYISNRLEGFILYLDKVALEYETRDAVINKGIDDNDASSGASS
jgi:uncharacterized protein YukE